MAKSEEEGAEVRHRLQLLIQCAIVNVDVYERETRVSKIHRYRIRGQFVHSEPTICHPVVVVHIS